jgi:hypothetical protein
MQIIIDNRLRFQEDAQQILGDATVIHDQGSTFKTILVRTLETQHFPETSRGEASQGGVFKAIRRN